MDSRGNYLAAHLVNGFLDGGHAFEKLQGRDRDPGFVAHLNDAVFEVLRRKVIDNPAEFIENIRTIGLTQGDHHHSLVLRIEMGNGVEKVSICR
jgi:hypothetical protein